MPPQAAAFARDVVSRGRPRAGGSGRRTCCGRRPSSPTTAIGLGLDPVPEVLLHPSVIERFARVRAGAVRRGAPDAAHEPAVHRPAGWCRSWHPADAPLPRERAKAPYSPAEIAGYLALADAQPTLSRRMRAAGLVCLGAGAGLIRADLRAVRGTDVICRSGGVIVAVRGARPRAVPVLARYHDRLLAAARFAGTGLVTGGTDPGRRNITTPLTRSLAGGAGLPRLDTCRLRATWLADCAELLGLATFMHAAGITCSQRLGDLLAALDPAGEAERGRAARGDPVAMIPLAASWRRSSTPPASRRGSRRCCPPGCAPGSCGSAPCWPGMLLSRPTTGPPT